MKYCFVPNSETRRKLYDETVRPEDGSDILHRWLQNSHKEHDAAVSTLQRPGNPYRNCHSICSKFNCVRISKISQSSTPVKFGTRRSTLGRQLHAFTYRSKIHSTMR